MSLTDQLSCGKISFINFCFDKVTFVLAFRKQVLHKVSESDFIESEAIVLCATESWCSTQKKHPCSRFVNKEKKRKIWAGQPRHLLLRSLTIIVNCTLCVGRVTLVIVWFMIRWLGWIHTWAFIEEILWQRKGFNFCNFPH